MAGEGKKGLGGRLLGVFVETGAEEKAEKPETTAADEVAALTRQFTPPASTSGATELPDSFDAPAIYDHAGITAEDRGAVEKVAALLKNFESLPEAARGPALIGTLGVMGINVASVTMTLQKQIRAVGVYSDLSQTQLKKEMASAQAQIDALVAKLEATKSRMAAKQAAKDAEQKRLNTILSALPALQGKITN
jgi:uncharacterized coiled-coil protein SlyX